MSAAEREARGLRDRQVRYLRLVEHYGPTGDLTPPVQDVGDYVLIQAYETRGITGGEEVAFVTRDDLAELFEFAGSEVLEGWIPFAIFDLNDGTLIDVHVTTPVVSAAEDQGITENPLVAEGLVA